MDSAPVIKDGIPILRQRKGKIIKKAKRVEAAQDSLDEWGYNFNI